LFGKLAVQCLRQGRHAQSRMENLDALLLRANREERETLADLRTNTKREIRETPEDSFRSAERQGSLTDRGGEIIESRINSSRPYRLIVHPLVLPWTLQLTNSATKSSP